MYLILHSALLYEQITHVMRKVGAGYAGHLRLLPCIAVIAFRTQTRTLANPLLI